MRNILPVLLKDGYKVGHVFQYPRDTTLVYSNMTPRQTRVTGSNGMIAFGMQYLVTEYLLDRFRLDFFNLGRERVIEEYRRIIKPYLGDLPTYDHIGALHDLGYLPIRVKAVPEGTMVPIRVPFLTICNTEPEFYWVTNMLETLISNILWLPCTSATTAYLYRRTFDEYARKTGGDLGFVQWQGHDFSFRGLVGVEAACLSGAAHLLSFTGSDTIPAIPWLERYYGAKVGEELIAGSVPATEHSVMSIGTKGGELETMRRLMTEVYPSGILSIVCDTWDFWKVITQYARELKSIIMSRPGKIVFRPDSGDPVKIICGDPDSSVGPVRAGALECLWEIFGGTTNQKGFRVLDPHVGLIYGDSITLERQRDILEQMYQKKFVSTIPVLGIGSYTYQYVTRDTYGLAIKATYAETARGPQPIFKDPVTDSGVKKSATGLLSVHGTPDWIACQERCSWAEEAKGMLYTILENGVAMNFQKLSDIRARIDRLVREGR